MRSLLHSRKDKKGISAMVGYVLLISMGIALAILVYNWLSGYVQGTNIEECSDDISLIIDDYYCINDDSAGAGLGYFNFTLKNKGLFTADGFLVRVHDRTDADLGFYLIEDEGVSLAPGGVYASQDYTLGNLTEAGVGPLVLTDLTFLEIQPFVYADTQTGTLACTSTISEKINCTN